MRKRWGSNKIHACSFTKRPSSAWRSTTTPAQRAPLPSQPIKSAWQQRLVLRAARSRIVAHSILFLCRMQLGKQERRKRFSDNPLGQHAFCLMDPA